MGSASRGGPDARLRSALIVPVSEASVVDKWRERSCAAKPSLGVPAHITLLFPFVAAPRTDAELVTSLGALVVASERFEFELREARRFPGVLYLSPAPAGPFIPLTEAILARFPAHPPYGGAFDSIEPHLRSPRGKTPCSTRPRRPCGRSCRIESEAREALLLEEVEPAFGRWRVHTRLPLGGSKRPIRSEP